jgi:hypothetical protein
LIFDFSSEVKEFKKESQLLSIFPPPLSLLARGIAQALPYSHIHIRDDGFPQAYLVPIICNLWFCPVVDYEFRLAADLASI